VWSETRQYPGAGPVLQVNRLAYGVNARPSRISVTVSTNRFNDMDYVNEIAHPVPLPPN